MLSMARCMPANENPSALAITRCGTPPGRWAARCLSAGLEANTMRCLSDMYNSGSFKTLGSDFKTKPPPTGNFSADDDECVVVAAAAADNVGGAGAGVGGFFCAFSPPHFGFLLGGSIEPFLGAVHFGYSIVDHDSRLIHFSECVLRVFC